MTATAITANTTTDPTTIIMINSWIDDDWSKEIKIKPLLMHCTVFDIFDVINIMK
jgi:hypothetical protein